MNGRMTVREQEKEAERGERPWSRTLKEHGPFMAIIMLWFPATLAFGLFMYALVETDGTKYTHLEVDFKRVSYVWTAWGILWTAIMLGGVLL